MKPMISIVIPSYNSSMVIKKCIESIICQKFREFELIIIDDNSSDDSYNLLQKYAKEVSFPMTVLRNSTNLGPSVSRKKGVEVAKGQYVCFIDSDDWIETNYFSSLRDIVKEENIDLVIFDYFKINGKGKKFCFSLKESIPTEMKKRLVLNIDSLWCMMIKKELLLKVDFPDIRNGEDMAIIPQILLLSKSIKHLKRPIYNYQYNPLSLSNASNDKKVLFLASSFETIRKAIPRDYFSEIEYLGIRNYLYGSLLAIFREGNDKSKAIEILSVFEDTYPNWNRNPYITKLPLFKQLFLKCVHRKRWFYVFVLCVIHKIVSRG